jgi:hypothetical protein
MKFNVMEIPDGSSGPWTVDTISPTRDDLFIFNLKNSGRYLPPGTYKRLMRGGEVIMSNTPAEMRDHSYLRHMAKGTVLINGLGLGCVLADVLNRDEVKQVTVVEISADVINLVAPYFMEDKRLVLVHQDAYLFKAPVGARYDYVWHDIWDAVCTDNLKGMAKLHKKYGRRSHWQGSWCRALCLRGRRKGI